MGLAKGRSALPNHIGRGRRDHDLGRAELSRRSGLASHVGASQRAPSIRRYQNNLHYLILYYIILTYIF